MLGGSQMPWLSAILKNDWPESRPWHLGCRPCQLSWQPAPAKAYRPDTVFSVTAYCNPFVDKFTFIITLIILILDELTLF